MRSKNLEELKALLDRFEPTSPRRRDSRLEILSRMYDFYQSKIELSSVGQANYFGKILSVITFSMVTIRKYDDLVRALQAIVEDEESRI